MTFHCIRTVWENINKIKNNHWNIGTRRTSKSASSVTINGTYLKLKISYFSTYNFSATNGPMTVHQHSFTDLQEVTDNFVSTFKILFLRSLSVTNVTQYKG